MRRVHPPPRAPHWHIDPPGRAVALALAPIVPGTGYELTFLDPGSINLQCLDSMNGFQFVKASDSEPESAPATRSPSRRLVAASSNSESDSSQQREAELDSEGPPHHDVRGSRSLKPQRRLRARARPHWQAGHPVAIANGNLKAMTQAQWH
jgi:hypothetical protein